MSRRHRNAIHMTGRMIRYQVSDWLKHNKNTGFNVPFLCSELGLNPDSRSDCNKIYSGCILYWRNNFVKKYKEWKKVGKLSGMDRHEAWRIMLYNFNQNDAYVFLSRWDRKLNGKYYYQPLSLSELEKMDRARLDKQWKSLGTIIDEMGLMEAKLVLPDGSRKPI